VGGCRSGTQTSSNGMWGTSVGQVLPAPESCNGADDDCDGMTDESLGSSSCGVGACQRTVQSCVGGVAQTCTPGSPGTESCNGIDDDCDGMTDESLGTLTCGAGACQRTVQACVGGAPQSCTPGAPSTEVCNGVDDDCDGTPDDSLGSTTCGQGVCRRTVQNCVGGVAQSCSPGTPGSESCNGLDDDCDGQTDESLGSTSCGVGVCQRTVQNCAGGMTQSCTPGAPGTEVCNGLDDDCDGTPDDSLGSTTCGQGVCRRTVQNCVNGVAQSCTPGASSPETCNGLDDDCDGMTDEGLANLTCGQGACFRSVTACVAGVPQTCTPGMPSAEVCNGADDDCDGTPDDNLGTSSCGVGACARTVASCVNGVPQSCTPGTPSTELCNAIDDDCDMAVDETFPQSMMSCSTGRSGICAAGTYSCVMGGLVCTQTAMAVPEVCGNRLDDNCNGQVDDVMVCNCNSAIDNDFDGENQCLDCNDNDGTIHRGATERCNGKDDDCDGTIDEGFDRDGDGFTSCGTVPGGGVDPRRVDCNDNDAFVFPLKLTDCGLAATPNTGNSVDDNCNGYVDETCNCNATRDRDGDGFNSCVDCVDDDPAVRPNGTEVCDGKDNDCNAATVDNCGVSEPCGFRQGAGYTPWPSGTDRCRPDLVCVTNVATGALTCGSFCNQTVGTGLNDSCAVGEGCYRNLIDSDNLHLCSVLGTGGATTGQSCSMASQCRSGDCVTNDGPGYCSDKCTHEAGCSNNTTCYVEKAPLTSGPFLIGNFYASRCRADARITAAKSTGQTCAAGECRGGTDMCVTYNGTARCSEACCTHADCPSGYSCNVAGPSSNTGYTTGGAQVWSFVPSCLPVSGNRVAGAACAANSDCRSGVCDRNLSICVDFCCNDSTCPNGTTCELLPFRFGNGNVSTVRACVFSPVPARIEQR
jgi:hypothetical protein